MRGLPKKGKTITENNDDKEAESPKSLGMRRAWRISLAIESNNKVTEQKE